ncbi:hypothetical protein OG976_17730 [Mycobacterium sp. NBC_00419]|uniref:hypothetical protein n=1 Tax=Mycobacterium sp. NBC_00419 TaxID=2975989 RepID=UPI002E1DB0B5
MNSQLSRRTLLRRAAQLTATVAALPVIPPATASDPSPTYYVSNAGNDRADGLTPASAWATIQKVNSALPGGRSTVLFRRGDTFFGELAPPFGCEVGAYDSGAKPILTMYKVLNRADGWTQHSEGIWTIDLGSPDTHGGYNALEDANIGFLMVDGAPVPNMKADPAQLTSPWDFCTDIPGHMLYVKSSANPTTLAGDIRAAPNGTSATGQVIHCINGSIDIHDLHITGSGGCGIAGEATDVHVHDCQIDYIGGSILQNGANPRYGNGIQNWANTQRWLIEGNEIAQVYDAAWTAQGRDAADGPVFWRDLAVRNNHIHDCGQTFELWSESNNASSPGFGSISIEGNLCQRGGYGIFSDVRPDQDVRTHLLTYRLQTPVDVTIQNNTFEDAYGAYSYHSSNVPIGYATRNNIIRLRPGTKMEYQRPETVEEAQSWQTATGQESGSRISILQ